MIRDHILFKNKKGVFETQFSFMSISLSIADMIVILLGVTISGILFHVVTGVSRNYTQEEIIISIIPIILCVVLVIKNQPIVPIYITIFQLFTLKKEKTKYKKLGKTTKKQKSKVLGFANELKIGNVTDENIPMDYKCDDLNIPKMMGIKLFKENGDKLTDTIIKIYLDNKQIDTTKTSLDGELEIYITPKTYGKKQLVLKDENNKVIRKKILNFIEKTTF